MELGKATRTLINLRVVSDCKAALSIELLEICDCSFQVFSFKDNTNRF